MKHRFTAILILMTLSVAAFAQKDMHSSGIFHADVVPRDRMVRTEVRGGEIRKFKLDRYLGVSFDADSVLLESVAGLVEADASSALSSETEHVGEVLTYALLQMPSKNSSNRYLCYQARQSEDVWKVVLLYLEGPASQDELKSMFEQQ